ncbi:MAG: hypothetical protein KGI80_04380 [Verrucomicrobiota bacterium]|nr:hypothetical protein [Verrucomicrobiota bacterium]
MRQLVTGSQAHFFVQNGHIELLDLAPPLLFEEVRACGEKRDLWRKSPILQTLVLRKIPRILSFLTHSSLRLAVDQYFPVQEIKEKRRFPSFFPIQNLRFAVFFSEKPSLATPALGISPFSTELGGVVFVAPHLLIDWSGLQEEALYCVTYAAKEAVYIENAGDPDTNYLKKLGYHFGDQLKEATHPLVLPLRVR